MYICYVDEAGDDGFPNRSSELFAFSMMYMHHKEWKANMEKIRDCRRVLKEEFGLPVRMEFHTKNFLLDKNPYRDFGFTHYQKKKIVFHLLKLVEGLNLRIVNVVINKKTIYMPDYNVFDKALSYGIQRVENDLRKNFDGENFLIISDEGRLPKMVSTARRMQAFNPIPSKRGGTYRNEILTLVEDPMAKASSESWFIQLADLVVSIVYYYKLIELGIGTLPGRMKGLLDEDAFAKMLQVITSRLNREAASDCAFGIATYPK